MRRGVVLVVLFGLAVGCRGGSTYQDPNPAESFANSVKNAVFQNLGSAREVGDYQAGADMLVEFFQDNADLSEAGEYRQTVEKIKQGAEELQQLASKNAGRTQLAAKAQELLKLAESLPGEVLEGDEAEGAGMEEEDY